MEYQGTESVQFASLFPGGIEHVHGGIDGVLAKKKKEPVMQLYRVKGRHNVIIAPVPSTAASMTCDDVYILQTDQIIYVWCGPDASETERQRGVEMAGM